MYGSRNTSPLLPPHIDSLAGGPGLKALLYNARLRTLQAGSISARRAVWPPASEGTNSAVYYDTATTPECLLAKLYRFALVACTITHQHRMVVTVAICVIYNFEKRFFTPRRLFTFVINKLIF